MDFSSRLPHLWHNIIYFTANNADKKNNVIFDVMQILLVIVFPLPVVHNFEKVSK